MLPAQHRMRRGEDFSAAMRGGVRGTSRRLVVHLDETAGSLAGSRSSRVGLAVSRAVGTAVGRNQVKRRLRALLRHRVGDLRPGTLLVVRALPSARDATSAELAADLDAALGRARRRGRARPETSS